jgi:hypothetical protein
MAENKLGDIHFEKDESVCRAFWCPPDGAPVLLCAMHLGSYETHASIRELFAALASEIAVNLERPAGSAVSVLRTPTMRPAEIKLDRQQFGCWTCTHPQAVDARHCLSGFSDEDLLAKLSPSGSLMFCCKVATAGTWAMAP